MSKVILITGASSGIGKAIGDLLCNKNFKVYGTSRDPSKYIDSNIQILSFDISQKDKIEEFVENATKELGGNLDCIVNNAGITQDNLAIRMSLEEWQKIIDINLTSTFLMSKFAIKKMLKNKSGKIVNITSVVGLSLIHI